MNTLVAEISSPGEILREELDARDWSQVEFAEILDRPPRVVSEIIAGKRAITPETAQRIGDALGTGPSFWLNLESQWQLSRLKRQNDSVQRRAKLYDRYPVRKMIRRGWIANSSDVDGLEANICTYFELKSIDGEPAMRYAAKQSGKRLSNKFALAWVARAQHLWPSLRVKRFVADRFANLYKELHQCTAHAEEVRKVPEILANAGIRFLVVEHLAGSRLDAVCFWADEAPVIAMSLRLDKLDNFWHSLYHELDHIENGEGKECPLVDEAISESASDPDLPAEEQRANLHATERLIPPSQLEEFIARVNPLFSENRIVGFADRIGVHPCIVVGQLQHRGVVPWSAFAKLRQRVREYLVPYALTDGFGAMV